VVLLLSLCLHYTLCESVTEIGGMLPPSLWSPPSGKEEESPLSPPFPFYPGPTPPGVLSLFLLCSTLCESADETGGLLPQSLWCCCPCCCYLLLCAVVLVVVVLPSMLTALCRLALLVLSLAAVAAAASIICVVTAAAPSLCCGSIVFVIAVAPVC
jgi:hypothetical protein